MVMREAIHHPLMPEFICEFHAELEDTRGCRYQARVYGLPQGTGIWDGVVVFFPVGGGPIRRTSVEAEHDSRQHLADWAATITPAYLAVALERSMPFSEAGARGPEHVEAAPLH